MNKNHIKLIINSILLILLIVLLVIVTDSKKINYQSPKPLPTQGGLNNPRKLKTTDIETLRKVAKESCNYIKDNSGISTPYNSEVMEIVEKSITNSKASISNLALGLRLLPNNGLLNNYIEPFDNPLKKMLFQYEQGNSGWYWGYGTFIPKNDKSSQKYSLMYYIVRMELGNEHIRNKLKLDLGSTTIYYISCGIGIPQDDTTENKWYYSPYCLCGGNYEIYSQNCFNFSTQPNVEGVIVNFNSTQLGNLHIDMKFNSENVNFDISCDFTTINRPYLNAKNGCLPCINGVGTLYFAYTQLIAKNLIIKKNDTLLDISNLQGVGWLDRQWGKSLPFNKLYTQMFLNLTRPNSLPTGLGRYIWLNLHFEDRQYLIFGILNPKDTVKDNYSIDNAYYNLYSPSLNSPRWGIKLKIIIKKVAKINAELSIPSIYSFTVKDVSDKEHTYILDGTSFGNGVTIDGSGNLHGTSSAYIYENDKIVGTGFMEANQFQTEENYSLTKLKLAGISPENFSKFNSSLKFSKVLFSWFILLIVLILIIYFIVLLIIEGKNYILKKK